MKTIACILIIYCIPFVSYSQLNPLNIGTLKPNDSVVIYYDVTINGSLPAGTTHIANRGTVTATGINIVTDDPDTGVQGDSTITLLNMFPLPVTLYRVNAKTQLNGIELTWNVTGESSILEYEIERSANGRQFSKIGQVDAQNVGNFQYSFFDQLPYSGINYYRLRIIGFDKPATYSIIVKVDRDSRSQAIAVFPNPVVGNQVILQLTNIGKENLEISLISKLGQVVFTNKVYHNGGSSVIKINLPALLTRGAYHLQIKGERSLHTQWLILQ